MKEMIDKTFSRHVIKSETGWTWRCARPGNSHYAYRVTWCPYNLIVTSDIGEIVISHYSFGDAWSAAAWINGAGFDYFMEKSNVREAYCPEATAELIIEYAYRRMREDRDLGLFEKIMDEFGSYGEEVTDPVARKEACRAMRNGDLSAETAVEITGDFEICCMRYPEGERWKYEALKLWAKWMWANEPAWHKAVRIKRRISYTWNDLKRYPPIFAPILYARFDTKGRMVTFNGSKTWRWAKRKDGSRCYEAIEPYRMLGRSLARFGLWRDQGSRWRDDGYEEILRFKHEDFRPLTPQELQQVAA